VIWWFNYLMTERWAHVPGAIHGPKEPWFVAALLALTVLVWWPGRDRAPAVSTLGWLEGQGVAALGSALLSAAFLVWFPWQTWFQIPFLDDWVPRYQSTREFINWLDQGWISGWQWNFLGGYHITSDVTQSLGLLGYLPMRLLGPELGFHLLHALLFASLPWLLGVDLKLAGVDRPTRLVAVGTGAVLVANYSYFLIRSGDTNSLAGVVLTLVALVGAHAARRGRVWGGPLLVTGLSTLMYAHTGSFVYAVLYLCLDAVLARDRASAYRALTAAVVAQIVALPLTWESWRHADYFHFNNVYLNPPATIDWAALARKIYYNVELLWLPGRWFNDYGGLALVLLPVTVALVVVDRSRVRLYAAGAVMTVALMRLNDPHFGYAFLRPIHMFVVFLAPVVAVVAVRYVTSRRAAWSLLAVVFLFVQIWWQPVPHISSIRDFNAALVDRVAAADGALVLVENNPHRNTTTAPGGMTVPSQFGNHFESLLAAETGRRLYAGYWDGWQWNPWRGQMLGGATWMGQEIGDVPVDTFVAELDRWGVIELFVWSDASARYLAAAGFDELWTDGVWRHFTRPTGDGREVVVGTGAGRLSGRFVGGATVSLTGVSRGEQVTIRTNFYPAWFARTSDGPVVLRDHDGQLTFDAPCDGACDVQLYYPRRVALRYAAVLTWLLAVVAFGWAGSRRQDLGIVQK
jgi:hypothetical protein